MKTIQKILIKLALSNENNVPIYSGDDLVSIYTR